VTNAFATDNDNATAGTGSVDFRSNTVYALCSNNGLLALQLTRTRPPPRMETISLLPDQNLRLEMSGGPGNFALEVVPGLSDWTVLRNLTAPEAVFEYTDPASGSTSRFYRVRQLPQAGRPTPS